MIRQVKKGNRDGQPRRKVYLLPKPQVQKGRPQVE